MTEREKNKIVITFLLEDLWRKFKRKNVLSNLLFALIILVSVFLLGEIDNLAKKNEVQKGNLIITTKFKNDLKDEKVTKEQNEKEIKKEDEKETKPLTNENIYSLININSATSEMLQSLNGIGESYANKIIEYRNLNGPFKSIEEIKNVKGIGDAKYNKIKKYIEV